MKASAVLLLDFVSCLPRGMNVSAILLSNMHTKGVGWHLETTKSGFVPGPKTFIPGVCLR